MQDFEDKLRAFVYAYEDMPYNECLTEYMSDAIVNVLYDALYEIECLKEEYKALERDSKHMIECIQSHKY